jgi:hypothetical protein
VAWSEAGAGAAELERAAPHSLQNRAPGGFDVPQALQDCVSTAPQPLQNFAPAAFSCPQLAQTAIDLA